MKKKIVSLVICMCMMISMSSVVLAAEAEQNNNGEVVYYEMMDNLVQPRWSYAAGATAALSIKNGTATMSYDCTGISGKCTKIVADAYLQKWTDGYTTIWSTSHTAYGTYGGWEDYYSSCARGYTYRLKVKYYVYNGSAYETFTIYSNVITYN